MNSVHTTSASSESSTFARLGALVARHRWPVLIAYLVFMAVVGIFGVRVFGAMESAGRIVTAAALLIAIAFASFLSSGATDIKQLGFGVTMAILLDATVVRALLVPAFMRIAGDAN